MSSVVKFTDVSLISVITCSKASQELLWAVLLRALHSALGEEQAGVVNSRHRDKPPSVATCFLVTAESHADVPHDLGKPLTFSNLVCGRKREEGSRACCPMFFRKRAFSLGSLPGLSHNRWFFSIT